jgi:hypothetical protein
MPLQHPQTQWQRVQLAVLAPAPALRHFLRFLPPVFLSVSFISLLFSVQFRSLILLTPAIYPLFLFNFIKRAHLFPPLNTLTCDPSPISLSLSPLESPPRTHLTFYSPLARHSLFFPLRPCCLSVCVSACVRVCVCVCARALYAAPRRYSLEELVEVEDGAVRTHGMCVPARAYECAGVRLRSGARAWAHPSPCRGNPLVRLGQESHARSCTCIRARTVVARARCGVHGPRGYCR